MREPVNTIKSIWLEVSNIALESGEGDQGRSSIDAQLKGDPDTERWFQFQGKVDTFKALMEAMKDKRPIYAKFSTKGDVPKQLGVTEIRVAFSAQVTR